MAPEQAKGRAVDRRADIFAFGCILYEMLTGRRAFEGDSAPEILSSVLQREPDWSRVPPTVPAPIDRLMRLCLEKDVKKRRQSAGDVRIDLEHALTASGATESPKTRASRWPLLAGIVGALVLVAVLAIPAAVHLREAPPPEMRLQIVTPPTSAPLHFALSPVGRFIVFVASESTDKRGRLYLRALEKTEAEPMSGTDEARYPFWSADSRSVGFFASGMLYRIDITGGPPQALTTAQGAQGGTWNEDGTILFAPNTVSAILRVSASGGEATAATRLDSPRQSGHRHPSFLPGGRQFLYYTQGEPQVSGIYLGSLDGQAPKRLTDADTAGEYLAPDHVVFVRQGALVARRLDAGRGELIGDPVPLSPSVGTDGTFRGGFSASASGILGHRTGGGNRAELTWFDRMGNVLGGAGDGNGPELSPDGRRIAFDRVVDGNRDVWVNDLVRGGLTRFTFNVAVDGYPLWSPDGSQVAFESNRNGTFDLFVRPSNGSAAEQLLLESSADSEWPLHWSKDGRYLLYQISDLKTREDLSALPMTGSDRTPIVVANSAFAERMGEFSPDGRWVAYETNESGRPEIIAQAFPEPKGTWPVSTGGGTAPRWSADGGEIYFVAPDGNIMAAPVTTKGSTLEAGKPLLLFSTQIVRQAFKAQYTVSRDGRFLVNNLSAEQVPASPITLIVNWQP